ncbi:transmembrane protein, putative (macronuclear) [Tetrahymena thermophila SB210]|uniref:Transmembrane protein, putative n=1 Tax=Tetrahymena thermophila (strain SB210) TaxID=312017 RepID=W7XJ92_TETTS|nr:transmembrane protein, putative [Tetrahymena thermophila SB210]EWS73959.1 transmembrane protein, putative [Tetrahymena thermophila SB210]|eukprot:XP_012653500.1 transmembrane protein, putative [Tetrahymena thermophila SB210]
MKAFKYEQLSTINKTSNRFKERIQKDSQSDGKTIQRQKLQSLTELYYNQKIDYNKQMILINTELIFIKFSFFFVICKPMYFFFLVIQLSLNIQRFLLIFILMLIIISSLVTFPFIFILLLYIE